MNLTFLLVIAAFRGTSQLLPWIESGRLAELVDVKVGLLVVGDSARAVVAILYIKSSGSCWLITVLSVDGIRVEKSVVKQSNS